MSSEPAKLPPETVRKQNRRIIRRSTWLTISAAALFSVVTYFVAKDSLMLTSSRPVPTPANVPPIVLHAYQKFGDGHLEEVHRLPNTGETLAFRLATTQPIHTALVASIDDAKPQVLFTGAKIPPGADRLLEKEDDLFTYQIKSSDHAIRFCLVGAEDHEHLVAKFADFPAMWAAMAKEACVFLNHNPQ